MSEVKYTIKDFIGTFDNVFTKDQCNAYIEIFKREKENKRVHDRLEEASRLYKDDYSLGICHDLRTAYRDEFDFLHLRLREALEVYLKQTSIMQWMDLKNGLHWLQPKIQKTIPSGGYHVWHVEKNYNDFCQRALVYTIYLNDIEEGGETEFLHQNVRCKAVSGRVCFFPANFPWVHRGNPPLNKDKYIITSWLRS